jgi:hypothetical protein
MDNNASLGAYAIMYVVQEKKNQVISLLLKNGVVVPNNASDMQIALLVTNLLKVSKSFYRDFSALLLNQETFNSMSMNMSGSYSNVEGFNFSQYTIPPSPFASSTTPAPTTPAKKEDASWINQGLGLLQTGFQGFLQLDENKTKRELANASVQLSSNQATTLPLSPTTGMGTGAIIGLSLLGITVVGLIAYLIIKKK